MSGRNKVAGTVAIAASASLAEAMSLMARTWAPTP